MSMKRVWVIVIAVLLMITAGCGNTAETQKVSLPEEISTGISVEDQDSVPVDGSALFQSVKGSEQNMDQQADAEIVDIEEKNDQQKEPTGQTDQASPFQEVSEATASETETQESTGSQEEPPQDSPSEPPALEESVEIPPEETEPAFDISFWISYAQSVAQEKGLQLESSAVDCWDNPIAAGPGCTCTERDINGYLSRYASDPDITDVWIWAEPRNDGSGRYDLYIGYA